jgi:hypothetical protein
MRDQIVHLKNCPEVKDPRSHNPDFQIAEATLLIRGIPYQTAEKSQDLNIENQQSVVDIDLEKI